jgi:hypothetical protein
MDEAALADFPVDWCDHVIPSATGGSADLENARSCDWEVNHTMRHKERLPVLYGGGLPLQAAGLGPRALAAARARAKRLQGIDESDWYLNRAFINLLWGAEWLCNQPDDCDPRDAPYRARAALRFLGRWRAGMRRRQVTPPEARGLVPTRLLPEMQALWEARLGMSEAELLISINALVPFMQG